jgi:hypothetical protein
VATFTETGKITLLDSNGATYTGHLTVWGNFNLNGRTRTTPHAHDQLAGSDGSTITAHEVSISRSTRTVSSRSASTG